MRLRKQQHKCLQEFSSTPPLRLLSEKPAKEREIREALEVLKSARVLPCTVNTHSWHTLLFRLEWTHLKELHFQGALVFFQVLTGRPNVKLKACLKCFLIQALPPSI